MNTGYWIRLTKIMMVLFFGLYVLIVAFGNVTDYDSNFQFVKHVMSMDTTFPGNALMYRSITSDFAHHLAYILIIITEWFTALACLYGGVTMFKQIKADAATFHNSKKWAFVGLLLGLCVWFLGFQVVGGEWFAMWQSQQWNGLSAAFRLTTYIGAALLALMWKEI